MATGETFQSLGSFPQVSGATVTSISHSPEANELWAKSQVLCCGADSHIRLLDQGPASREEQFPVCKVATNDRQRRFIVDEFEILRDLASNAAPAVQVHPEPLVDGKGDSSHLSAGTRHPRLRRSIVQEALPDSRCKSSRIGGHH